MKRTPLKRGAPLARGQGLTRSPMKRSKSKRAAKSGGALFYRHGEVDEAFRAWIREQPCALAHGPLGAVPLAVERVQAAHVKSRGAGGADRGNLIPLCLWHHAEQHSVGTKYFERVHKFDFKAAAASHWARYQRETGTP